MTPEINEMFKALQWKYVDYVFLSPTNTYWYEVYALQGGTYYKDALSSIGGIAMTHGWEIGKGVDFFVNVKVEDLARASKFIASTGVVWG